ncbi:ribonuclease R [Tundrisphaera lichenicola]|uniref:ribonuclease R n=1 Tax=Tundrisphaera lichenicola TaxID=2029860 RepID=UPI003EBFB1FF
MDDHEARILALVADDEYNPMTLKAMARRFRVPEDEYPSFRNTVKGMVKSGKLDIGKDKTLRKAELSGTVTGTYRRSSKGFGFVRPVGLHQKADQIFIPVDAGRDASTGDEVLVKIVERAKGPGYNPEGRVVKVVARASGLFVGHYFEKDGNGYVKIDGTIFSDPIYVGDPGAKGARPGDKVAMEMASYPTPVREGEGVITEVFGPRGEPKVETVAMIRALGIPDVFDDDTLDEARQQAKAFNEEDVAGRLDLRDQLTVTIDPATARDFDDAITLTRDEKGFWLLGVHIADVSHFVRLGSPLDDTARRRGTSVYLPDRVIPMLPEVLSNSLASLQAGHARYTVSAILEFDPDGVRTHSEFARSVIKVDRRFAYEEVFEVLQNPDGELAKGLYPEIRSMLSRMLELAMILRKRRFKRGALELNMPEVEIDLGEEGEVVGAHLASNDVSHQIIEDFMLAANEAVASHLTANKAGFLRRVHPDPDPRKLKEFAGFAGSLGIEIKDFLSRFELQRVLAESAEKPEAYAVHFGLLRSLKQAVYSPEQEGHYALASEDYCHFTSPIRRYPDLQVHRQLTALLADKKPRSDFDELVALAEHCTRTERRAETAERELIKIKLLTYLAGHIGERFHAVIVGVEDFGFFCRLVEFPAEGLVHITALADDYYYLESGTHTLIGRRGGHRYRLGDRVEVTIARVDIDRRELDLTLGEFAPGDAPAEPRPPREPRSRHPSTQARAGKSRGKAPKPKKKGRGRPK